MDKKKAALLLSEREEKGLSYRTLSKRYNISVGSIHNMVKRSQSEQQAKPVPATEETPIPDDVKALKEALRVERLKNELLNAVIDISSKELGVDLRKKHGTRQS